MTYYGRTFSFKVDTLERILTRTGISENINFIKMDIEGYEEEVISNGLQIINRAQFLSLEIHGKDRKHKIDKMLIPKGYVFEPVTMTYIYKESVKSLLSHPLITCKVYFHTLKNNPRILSKAITGLDITKDFLVNGMYVKKNSKFNR